MRCFIVLVVFAIAMGCARRSEETVFGDGLDLTVRHRVRSETKNGLKAEIWLVASTFKIGEPISVGVRLYPAENTSVEIPKAVGTFKLIQNRLTKRQQEGPLTFESSQETKAHWEVTRMDDGSWSEKALFPGSSPTWESVVMDPFKSRAPHEGLPELESGDFQLDVDIRLEGGPTFSFEKIPLRFLKRR